METIALWLLTLNTLAVVASAALQHHAAKLRQQKFASELRKVSASTYRDLDDVASLPRPD